MKISEFPPFSILKGLLGGFEDGLRGKMDTNLKYNTGERENDPTKKSRAGRFLSEYAGWRGGAHVGERNGKWVGGLFGGSIAGYFAVAGVAGSAMLTGGLSLFPIFAGVVLTAVGAWAGANIGGFTSRYIGGAAGMAMGGMLGPIVGAYNGLFHRGAYAKTQEKEKANAQPDAPQTPRSVETVGSAPSHMQQGRMQESAVRDYGSLNTAPYVPSQHDPSLNYRQDWAQRVGGPVPSMSRGEALLQARQRDAQTLSGAGAQGKG